MKYFIIIFAISFSILSATSIYDIQYTTAPAGGTYPSLYEGQVVTTGGIVTGINYSGGRFFISSSTGGSWNGIYVYDNGQNVVIGDSVIIEAEVSEYYGFTELSYLNYCNVISSGNPLPDPVIASTNEIFTQEEYESVLVQVTDVVVTQAYDEWSEWHVSDGSGSCIVSTGFVNFQELEVPIILSYPFSNITGIVSFGWDDFRLNPRNIDDLQSADDSYIISISDQYIFSPEEFEIPIYLTSLGEIQQVQSYQFDLAYDQESIEYIGYNLNGTLSSGGSITVDQPVAGSISVTFTGDFSFNQTQTLLKLNFVGVESGTAELDFTAFSIDNIDVNYFSIGEIILLLESTPIGDTLTVIQRPISNIPSIAAPGDELSIVCLAEPATSGWEAILQHQEKVIQLNISSSIYNNDLERWQLTADVPTPDIYELYDLVVSANGIETDTTLNAVKLIPEYKENYYFVHITDAHLPTHIFYPDPQSLIDTTEVNDFREVIKDINLLNPEFVLFTGDLVNEGEMEDFENRRVYTKAQKLLAEFEVPVYLVTGNHDVGGWFSSPPVQGTARHNWWNFFGWNWLQNPPVSEQIYTQNYSFNYGPVHYIGMEAYINYDDYMFNIFGDASFTATQIEWLTNEIQEYSSSLAHVVYYHYDFSDQINLVNMGIDMALFGHIHSNSGSITSPPYNVSTESICDGNRAYRIIYVEDAVLEPTETVNAGWSGDQLYAAFSPENNGLADSLYCFVENSQNLSFPDAQLKFIMPSGADEYIAYNGTIDQIDDSGEFAICYVSFEIPANENISVSVVANIEVSAEDQLIPEISHLSNYPNPFNPSTKISFQLSDIYENESIEIAIYNMKGQKIKNLSPKLCHAEPFDKLRTGSIEVQEENNYSIIWDGTDQADRPVSSGIYFYKLKTANLEKTNKMLLLR